MTLYKDTLQFVECAKALTRQLHDPKRTMNISVWIADLQIKIRIRYLPNSKHEY